MGLQHLLLNVEPYSPAVARAEGVGVIQFVRRADGYSMDTTRCTIEFRADATPDDEPLRIVVTGNLAKWIYDRVRTWERSETSNFMRFYPR